MTQTADCGLIILYVSATVIIAVFSFVESAMDFETDTTYRTSEWRGWYSFQTHWVPGLGLGQGLTVVFIEFLSHCA